MKKLKMVLIIITGISINSFGQVQTIGLQSGLNITNYRSNVLPSGTDNRYGLIGGLNYGLLFQSKYSVDINFLYNQQGFGDKITFTDNKGNFLQSGIMKFYSDYLSLPLKIGYVLGDKFNGFAKMGICPSILISAQTTTPIIDASGNITGDNKSDSKSSLSKFDLGGLIELGAGYRLSENFDIFTSLMYSQSFNSFSKQIIMNGSIRHSGLSLSLGLKYRLKNV
jgi:hypothetical protein